MPLTLIRREECGPSAIGCWNCSSPGCFSCQLFCWLSLSEDLKRHTRDIRRSFLASHAPRRFASDRSLSRLLLKAVRACSEYWGGFPSVVFLPRPCSLSDSSAAGC